MLLEAREAPAAVERQLAHDQAQYAAFASLLRNRPPGSLLTVARGSSDHAANFMAYLIMARMGRLVTSLPMSLVTLYRSRIRCEGLAAFAFSQSGQSPDLVEPMRYFTEGGALTAAFVNEVQSPLARAAQSFFPLHAGAETSVAATKSFIAQLVGGARLVAAWQQDPAMLAALEEMPGTLARAVAQDWSAAVEPLQGVDRLFVIGRATGLAVAQEAALKFKETCGIHAEAFSGAEVQHGPMALVEQGFPLLVFALPGPAQASLLAMAQEMRARGARVLLAAPPEVAGCDLPVVATCCDDIDPISAVQSFYPLVEAVARARGLDPDNPSHLRKVTRTL